MGTVNALVLLFLVVVKRGDWFLLNCTGVFMAGLLWCMYSLTYLCELMLCPNPPSLQLQVRTAPRHDPSRTGDFKDLLLQLLANKGLLHVLGSET